MRGILLSMLLAFISLPAIAAKNELKLGVTTSAQYDDNVSNVSGGRTGSYFYQIGPSIQFDTADSNYEAGFDYFPRFAFFSDARDDDINQTFGAHATYRPIRRLTMNLRDSLVLDFDADRDFTQISGIDLDNGGEKKTFRNRFSANIRYQVRPRFSLSSKISHSKVAREDRDLSDNSAISGSVQGEYSFSSRGSVGIGANLQNRSVQASRATIRGDTTTKFNGFFVSWSRRFTPIMSVSASGGPTWVTSSREGDGRGSSTKIDYFANADISTPFDQGAASLSYSRSGSEFSASSDSFVVDSVIASMRWTVSRKVNLSLSGEWSQRKSVQADFSGTSIDKVLQWRASTAASYKFSRGLLGVFTLSYLRQQQAVSGAKLAPSNRIRAGIRLNYTVKTLQF